MDACDEGEETKRLRSTGPTSDTGDNAEMELTDEETRKRALVECIGDDDDELGEEYRRAEDFVAKASMDELNGNWLTDDKGVLDEDAAGDTGWEQSVSSTGRRLLRRPRKRWTACWRTELLRTWNART